MGGLLYSPIIIPILAIFGLFSWLSISAIMSAVQGIVKHRNEIELKQMLAARGMSADEIERVLQASGSGKSSDSE